MADSAQSNLPRTRDMLQIHKELERMVEDVEDISVQLTWMAYDMVAQRTVPELHDSVERMKDAYLRCRADVFGDHHLEETNKEKCPALDPAATNLSDL